MQPMTDVVKNLLIINVILFFGLKYGVPFLHYDSYMVLRPIGGGFNPYQLISHMFMHGDVRHLLFNMLGLFFIGPAVEMSLGSKRFIQLYILAGVVGGVVHLLTSIGSAVGASGGFYGVLVAFATMYPNRKMMFFPIPMEIKAKYLVGAFILIDFFSGLSSARTGIAHFAHIGGGLAGFLLILLWKKNNLY